MDGNICSECGLPELETQEVEIERLLVDRSERDTKYRKRGNEIERLREYETEVRHYVRCACEEIGDLDWDDSLHLGDVVEKHLARPASRKIRELVSENERLREWKRDAMMTMEPLGDICDALGDDIQLGDSILRNVAPVIRALRSRLAEAVELDDEERAFLAEGACAYWDKWATDRAPWIDALAAKLRGEQ